MSESISEIVRGLQRDRIMDYSIEYARRRLEIHYPNYKSDAEYDYMWEPKLAAERYAREHDLMELYHECFA